MMTIYGRFQSFKVQRGQARLYVTTFAVSVACLATV